MSEHRSHESAHEGAGRKRALKLLPALATILLVGFSLYASRAAVRPPADLAQPSRTGGAAKGDDKATAKAVAAANAFLESLDEKQRARALLDYDSGKKPRWSNLPVTMVPRNGVRLGELTRAQRTAALDAVAAVLSKEGFQKVIDIMEADDRLIKGNNKMQFGTEHFYLALFGKPSPKEPWMLQFGGHHLGINVTVVGKHSVLTPTHTGAQPVSFLRAGKTVRPLGLENDLAFRLVNMLDEKQQAKAILGKEPRNLKLGPGKDGETIPAEGLKGNELTVAQRALLLQLIGAWVNILPGESAENRLAEIKGKLPETYFAWYGPTTNGSAAYFRVQGPTLVIEYAPQGGPGHIHTIIRNPKNDYARQLTKP
jgi:hypothetical protein